MGTFSRSITESENSATMAVKGTIARLRDQGIDVINMASGTPDFPTPDHIIEQAKAALDHGKTKSTETKGILELRTAIAEKFREDNDITTQPENIIVTPGSKFSIYLGIDVLLNPGEEAVVLDPSWVSYPQMITQVGGTVNRATLDPESGFTPGSVDLTETVSNDTKLVVLNSPSNPAGAVFSLEELRVLRDLAVDHDFWVVSDEIYEKIIFSGSHHSIGALDGMADRTISVNGFSKAYAMTGWRLGYLTGPSGFIEQAEKVQAHAVSSPTSFAQYGGITALTGPQECVTAMRNQYKSRITVVMDALEEAGVRIPRPEGAFYAFVPVNSRDDVSVCQQLLEQHHVAAAPGSAFGVPGYIRLSATNPPELLEEGIGRIKSQLATKPTVP